MENKEIIQRELLNPSSIVNWDNFLVGTYKEGDETLEESMRNSMNRFTRLVPKIKKSSNILVLSDGHSFLPRFIASEYGCKVTVICVDEDTAKQIESESTSCEECDITVLRRDFYLTGFNYNTFDMAWSVATLYKRQDLMKVLREINRILVPQGRLILCELTKTDKATEGYNEFALHSDQEILNLASRADLENVYFKSLTSETVSFYRNVEKEFLESKSKIVKTTSKKGYASSLEKLKGMIANANDEKITWNFIQFQKRNA